MEDYPLLGSEEEDRIPPDLLHIQPSAARFAKAPKYQKDRQIRYLKQQLERLNYWLGRFYMFDFPGRIVTWELEKLQQGKAILEADIKALRKPRPKRVYRRKYRKAERRSE